MERRGLLCIGLTTLDVVGRAIDAIPPDEGTRLIEGVACAPAGTAAGAALIAARLGMPVRLAGAVGDDAIGRFVRLFLDEAGVDTGLLEALPGHTTSTTILAVDSQGRRPNFHALGAGALARPSPAVVAAAANTRFLHYAGVGGRLLDCGPGAALAAGARAAGAVVTCDLISPGRGAREEAERLLPAVDWFMPSAAEAAALTGGLDLDAAAAAFLALGARGCVIKDGARGSILFADGARRHIPAFAITPMDTTSCGDSYCAGFIAALDCGWPPVEACRFATATAALVAQGLATLGALEDFAATEAAMRRMTPLEAI